jgi:serine/threonine-protein kinase
MPRARLADFGIAAAVGQPRLTHASHSVGTLGYAAPESLEAGWDPDPRADLYGAGLTAFELLTAQRPGIDGASLTEGAGDVAATLVRAGVPVELSRLVLALVSPDPDDRPATAADARQGLAATGLVAGSTRELGRHHVEVFDQLPELPDGWGEEGAEPSATGAPRPERELSAVPPVGEDARSTVSASTSSAGRAAAMSRTGLLLLVLGMLMILAAVLLPR